MNMISTLRQRIRQHGSTVVTDKEYDELQAEWITRCGIDADAAIVAAIEFAISTDEGIEFLRLWQVGDFDAIRADWPDCPDDVFPAEIRG